MIYFVQSASGPIKIGTTNDLHRRFSGLRTASAVRLVVLGTMPGGAKAEAALHLLFADLRLEGEWFKPDARLLDFIEQRATKEATMPTVINQEPIADARLAQSLIDLGSRIRRARIRRRLTTIMMSERCGMSRPTYRAIERGDEGVTIGRYARVLKELQMLGDVEKVAANDELGYAITDAELMARTRVRA